MRKKICMWAVAIVLSLGAVAPSLTVYADETKPAQEETVKGKEETKAEQSSDKKDDKTKESNPAKETETAPPKTEPATTEADKGTDQAEENASSSVMPVVTGYLFDDGSFDVWMQGSGLYVGEGQIVIPTRLSYSSYPEGYQAVIEIKAGNYALYEIDTADVSLTTAVILPNGEWEKCSFVRINDATSLCLMAFQDAGLKLSVPEYSRDAWPDTVYMTGYQGNVMATIIDDMQAGTTIRSGTAITMECDKDVYTTAEEQIGSVISNKEGYVIGMVTRPSTDKASVVRAGDILRLMENREPEKETTTAAPEYDDGTDKEMLSAIESLEAKVKEFKETDYTGYTKDTAQTLKAAIEKAEEDLRTATPDIEVIKADVQSIDNAVAALEPAKAGNKGSGVLVLIVLIFVLIAVVSAAIIVPIIVFKKPKDKSKETDKNQKEKKAASPLMEKLAKLLGVKLKDKDPTNLSENHQEKHKTGDLKKDGYGGEMARAMYEEEQKRKEANERTEKKSETQQAPAPKNVVLGTAGTSVLKRAVKKQDKPDKTAWLVDKDGKRIEIFKTEFWIGREQMAVDYCITNETIGRRHAVIRTDGESFTIEDNGSVNKTYLNGVQLQKGSPVKLTNNDIITLSDETLTFIDRED